ncbi:hypothetical protein WMZ97_13330 [Lentibacillus sp. N15]|uniref:hypothetical protein n=1 Tax=Lentibacillus songyuanensis TaxID=3136161 RepID=UPI0031BB9858
METGQIVRVIDKDKVRNDKHLEDSALKIIEKSNFEGDITKIEDGIHFVGFSNDLGWVTQGYKAKEIEEVK